MARSNEFFVLNLDLKIDGLFSRMPILLMRQHTCRICKMWKFSILLGAGGIPRASLTTGIEISRKEGPMKITRHWWRTLAIVLVSTLLPGGSVSSLLAQNQRSPDSTTTTPVSTVVSVEAKHGKEVPAVYKEDVRVFQEKTRVAVKDWVPLQGAQGALELYILIDDATDTSIGQQFDDIRKFINGQPVTASIGVGYMRNGT